MTRETTTATRTNISHARVTRGRADNSSHTIFAGLRKVQENPGKTDGYDGAQYLAATRYFSLLW
jgi:hypothetical protein